jgi:hypothetical protein
MPFSSWPFAFGRDLAQTVERLQSGLYPRRLPPKLYHYTTIDGVLGIINARALWATCIEDLEDQTEIRHGIEMIQEEVRRRQPDGFPGLVIELLSGMLSTRRAWTFVACFRAKRKTKERGPYCLQFDTLCDWEPRLRSTGFHADVRYHRVIYKPAQQRKAIRHALDAIIDLARRYSRGIAGGPWMKSIASVHSQAASQSLMDLISAFKCSSFKGEKEWRIVCRPQCSIADSDPSMNDSNFRPLIKKDERLKRRHVELTISEQTDVFYASPKRAIPFNAVYPSPDAARRADVERIRDVLRDGGRPVIEA